MQPDGLVVSPAFSHVAVVPAGAVTIYIGGQNGVDADGKILSDDVAEQSARAIDNASTALEASGRILGRCRSVDGVHDGGCRPQRRVWGHRPAAGRAGRHHW